MTTAPDFPPARHVVRDLGYTSQRICDDRHAAVAQVPSGLRDRARLPSVAGLAILADAVAAVAVLPAAQPDWTATANLGLHLTGRTAARAVVVDARVVRAGARLVTARVTIHDAGAMGPDGVLDELLRAPADPYPGVLVAEALVSFVRMPASRSRARDTDIELMSARRVVESASPAEGSLAERVGVRTIDGDRGLVEVDAVEYVGNSMGSITGGVHVLAMQAATESVDRRIAASGVDIWFLAPAKMGPIRASATQLRGSTSNGVCSVEVTDEGAGQLVSVGTVGFDLLGDPTNGGSAPS